MRGDLITMRHCLPGLLGLLGLPGLLGLLRPAPPRRRGD